MKGGLHHLRKVSKKGRDIIIVGTASGMGIVKSAVRSRFRDLIISNAKSVVT